MALNGNDDEVNGYNSVVKNGALPDANLVKSMFPPIGSLFAWMKTFNSRDSGNADTNTLNKLEDSGGGFTAAGVAAGDIIANTTDSTYGYVKTVDSDTVLSIATITSGVNLDLFPLGTEAYNIYSTPTIPDGWVECNGQALSDSDSPFNGATIPDLNGSNNFLRGAATSGSTGGSATHAHGTNIGWDTGGGTPVGAMNTAAGGGASMTHLLKDSVAGGTSFNATGAGIHLDTEIQSESISTLPTYYEITWIMRIK